MLKKVAANFSCAEVIQAPPQEVGREEKIFLAALLSKTPQTGKMCRNGDCFGIHKKIADSPLIHSFRVC